MTIVTKEKLKPYPFSTNCQAKINEHDAHEDGIGELKIIKNYNPRPFEQFSSLPTYVTILAQHDLLAKTKSGYIIKLAKLTIGKSISAGNLLIHALFESFSDHGERMVITRTRVSGQRQVFSAVINAMMEAGVEFEFITPCHSEAILIALGAWIQVKNPEIEQFKIVSQKCH